MQIQQLLATTMNNVNQIILSLFSLPLKHFWPVHLTVIAYISQVII